MDEECTELNWIREIDPGRARRAVLARAFCAALLSASATWSGGCTHTQAKTVPDAPLEMPAPPPRSVEPVDVETPQPVPLPEEPARRAPPRRPAAAAARTEA